MQFFAVLIALSSSAARRVGPRLDHQLLHGTSSQDAIELCGDGSDSLKEWFEGVRDCEDSPPDGFDLELGLSTTVKQQASETRGRAYAEPPFRLYVCHEGSSIGGVLFSQIGANVFSKNELGAFSAMLFSQELWPMKNTAYTQIRANVKRIYAGFVGKPARDMNVPYLWCLDAGGNLIIAPEIQYGYVYKHGDLTPGRMPWTRPSTEILNASRGARCCCKELPQLPPTVVGELGVVHDNWTVVGELGVVHDNWTVVGELGDVHDNCEYIRNGNLCCKVYPEGCPKRSHWKQKDDFDSFCGHFPNELQMQGTWRGIARAAGEVRFPDDQPPIVQDASSYSLTDRVKIPVSMPSTEDENDPDATLKTFELSGALGTCAMRKLRRYWLQVLGAPWNEAQFGEVHYEKKKKAIKVLDADADSLDEAFEAQMFKGG